MTILWIILAMLIAYLIGSVPFGFIIPKVFKGIDIREHGSKNVGSTNVKRILGFKYALPVFLLDCFKGALPIIIVRYILGYNELNFVNGFDIVILYGMGAVLGHIFPVWLNFKGGKAVATGVGAAMALSPIVGLSGIAIFFIVAFSTKYVSIGSVVATFLVGVGMFLDTWLDHTKDFASQSINLSVMSLLVLLVIFMHRKNFVRLYNGTESRIGSKQKLNQKPKDESKS